MDSMDTDREFRTLKRRRSKRSSGVMIPSPIDRLSSLPESIISSILSLLPTKSAVATSFLSKGWKFRWAKITAFDFKDRFWPDPKSPDPETVGFPAPPMNFVEFVNLVFACHNDPIHKLRLQWKSENVQSNYIKIWLTAAIARNFRVLDLATVTESSVETMRHSDENYRFELPAGLYTCKTLEVLKLRGSFLIKLPRVVRLPRVAVLQLACVKYESDESLEKLISSCPVLETLKVMRNHHHGDLIACKVCSPSLKHLDICVIPVCEFCLISNDFELVIDTPALENLVIDSAEFSKITCVQPKMPVNELEINSVCESDHPFGDGVAGIIQACDGAKVIMLHESSTLALARGKAPLPATFGRLTKLVVDITRSHWNDLLDLIHRCVNLQVLDITPCEVEEFEKLPSCGSYWNPPAGVPSCMSSSLKYVYIREFEGAEDEMAMLQLLLDHGPLIERVTLCSNEFTRSSDRQKLNILTEVTMLARASATCKILFS